MRFYLFLTIGTLIFFWAFDSSLKKSTEIHCRFGLIQEKAKFS